MSDTDSRNEEDLEKKYSDKPQYTVTLNGKKYEVNEDWRESIQERAKLEYEENHRFSCWWKIASATDAEDSIHEEGDPILVIETAGPMVPWDNLDQLELEMQDTSAFQEFSDGGSDVDSGNGMRTVKPDEVKDDSDDEQEKSRTHFGVTPQDFQEVPSPDGEDPDKVPPKPKEFDDPNMVMWVPEDPDIEHTWEAGEAITSCDSWVEWNVQAKANQPRSDKNDSHDHFESLAQMYDCEKVGELQPSQEPEPDTSDSQDTDDDVPEHFKEGKYGGNNWNV
jgi:hypothetical protein